MLLSASRTPWERAGDLDAQVGANVVGVRRLARFAGAPFEELLARIVALRRRRADLDDAEGALRVGPLALDPESRRVTRDGTPITLTVREFELLRYLMSNADKVVSRERLLNGVWSYGYDPGTKIVDVYVRYLRAKIDVEGEPSLIETVRGVGYMMPSKR